MPITPINQSKNAKVPVNKVKFRSTQAIYGQGVYGIAVYRAGVSSSVPTNQSKSVSAAATIAIGSPIGLLLALTYADQIVVSGGWVNQPKN